MTSYEIKCSSRRKKKEEMKHIPPDIIQQILLRLPVKEIIRSRLVSKHWCALSSDTSFVHTHLNFVKQKPSTNLIICYGGKIYTYDKGLIRSELWTPKEIKDHVDGLVGSCNGLVVCTGVYGNVVVFNPATHESISPPNPSFGMNSDHFGISWWGKSDFGFNPNTNEYKIIHFYYTANPNDSGCRVEVFTLLKYISSWRQIEGVAPVKFKSRAINIGAAIYWKVNYYISFNHSIFSTLFFDLSKEEFGRIEAPKEDDFCVSQIMDMNGRLCWVSFSRPCQTMKLWILNEKSEKKYWALLQTNKLPDLIRDNSWWLELWHLPRNKIVIEVNESVTERKYYYLDFKMKNDSVEFEYVLRKYCGWAPFSSTAIYSYVESLLPVPKFF